MKVKIEGDFVRVAAGGVSHTLCHVRDKVGSTAEEFVEWFNKAISEPSPAPYPAEDLNLKASFAHRLDADKQVEDLTLRVSNAESHIEHLYWALEALNKGVNRLASDVEALKGDRSTKTTTERMEEALRSLDDMTATEARCAGSVDYETDSRLDTAFRTVQVIENLRTDKEIEVYHKALDIIAEALK